MKRWLWLALLVAPAAAACELPGGATQKVQGAATTILYRTAPAVEQGRHFAVDFIVCPAPESVQVDAWMPEHRHGMNYRPRVAPLGGGRYHAEGFLFHMSGRWEMLFEVRAGGKSERLAHSLRIE